MQLKDSRVENYFAKLETQILGRMKAGLSPDEARDELVRNTGISDPILIDEITELGIPHEGVVAFRIYPLILVAWVEGISDAERVAVKNAAKQMGFQSRQHCRHLH